MLPFLFAHMVHRNLGPKSCCSEDGNVFSKGDGGRLRGGLATQATVYLETVLRFTQFRPQSRLMHVLDLYTLCPQQ